ncbi:S9 family peptidase [Gloeobacter violaceus]|uniref:Gll1703 protein n=1 Tax=Gloeobacter violaceus (strain ATCC 29082 / PCC 7421) TaxID=251221 RepID=Q7NJX8_GLOVI|nr:S9 family peptidase [Gloeobacter violaceus]BAC89644.1 gll1703 [Gloeobacter violaceus PCC 7421]
MGLKCLCRRAVLAAALFVCCAGFAVPLPGIAAESKRPITEKDLLKFNWVADPRLSPDGARVVYVRVSVDEKKDTYTTSLWQVATATGEARPLSTGARDSSPRWSPDGKTLAFLRSAEKDGKSEPPQIHLLSLDGGEARALTDLPKGAGGISWSPDSRRIAFTSSTKNEDIAEKQKKNEDDKPKKSDVRVIKRAIYRFNGAGYLEEDRPGHIWIVDLPTDPAAPPPAAKQITKGEFEEDAPAWSPDGTRLYFTSDRTREAYYEPVDTDIYTVSAGGGEISRVVNIDGPIGTFALSPDGRRIAFVGFVNAKPEYSYTQPDLFVADLSPGAAPKNLTADYDFDAGDGIGGDQRAPRAAADYRPVWSGDGRSIVIATAERGRANLKRFDAADGRASDVTTGDHEIAEYTATPDGSRFAGVISRPTEVGDIYLLSLGASPRRLTRGNAPLFDTLQTSAPEEINYPSFDGQTIQGWLFKPPGFEAGKKYPLILNIHGGPHIAWGYTFFHEVQWMAAKGYVVLYTNPRGSTGYGQKFGNSIQFNYPGDDAKDLMAGVDYLLARGYVDANRLGVTGGSGGGVLTNWLVGHTDRFKAAVSQRSIADWTSWWYTADFTLFTPTWFRGAPWREEADFKARSPMTYVEKIKTPLMLIEGEADLRTPPGAGGEQLFRALKYLKRPVVMVQFPGENHDLSRTGKPSYRIERLQHIVGWFDKYLQGVPKPEYDLPAAGPVRQEAP